MRRSCRAKCQQDGCDNQGQKSPEVDRDLSDVVATAAKHGKKGVAEGAFERGYGQSAIGFQVADSASMALRRLRSAISFGVRPPRVPLINTPVVSKRWRAIAAVDDGEARTLVRQGSTCSNVGLRVWSS